MSVFIIRHTMDVYIRKTSKSTSALVASRPNYDGFVVIVIGCPGWNRYCSVPIHAALVTLLDGAVYHDWDVVKKGDNEAEHWRRASLFALTRKDWKLFLEGRGYRAGVGYLVMKHYK